MDKVRLLVKEHFPAVPRPHLAMASAHLLLLIPFLCPHAHGERGRRLVLGPVQGLVALAHHRIPSDWHREELENCLSE